MELIIEAKLVIVQAHKPSLLKTNDSMSKLIVGGWWNSLLVVRAVRGMAEFLARGAIKIRIGIVTFYSDDHSQTAKGANVNMPVNMSSLKLYKKATCLLMKLWVQL